MSSLCYSLSITGLIVAVMGVAGCAASGPGMAPEEQVSRRAKERLDYLMVGEFSRALGYTTPRFQEATSARQYAGRYGGVGNWKSAEVEKVVCEEERCDVRVQVTYEMVRPRMENTRPLDEVWILIDGKWYIYES